MRRRKERLKIVECKCESKLIFQLVRWFDTPRIGLVVASNLICPSFLYQVQMPELVIKTEKAVIMELNFRVEFQYQNGENRKKPLSQEPLVVFLCLHPNFDQNNHNIGVNQCKCISFNRQQFLKINNLNSRMRGKEIIWVKFQECVHNYG